MNVVETLLETSHKVELAPDFTAAAMAEVRSIPQPRPPSVSYFSFITVYLCAAWAGLALWLASIGIDPQLEAWVHSAWARGWLVVASMAASDQGASHDRGPLLAFGLGVLLLDVAFTFGITIIYRAIQPHLATQLESIMETGA